MKKIELPPMRPEIRHKIEDALEEAGYYVDGDGYACISLSCAYRRCRPDRLAWCDRCQMVFQDDLPPLAGGAYRCPTCDWAIRTGLTKAEFTAVMADCKEDRSVS